MTTLYRNLYRQPVAPPQRKDVHSDNVEVLFEQGVLKIRDTQEFSYKESPSVELMFLASTQGIRPGTPATNNISRNMFFISEDKVHHFLQALESAYPEFKKSVEEKIEADKNNSQTTKLSPWF